jgi:hypothetical protein
LCRIADAVVAEVSGPRLVGSAAAARIAAAVSMPTTSTEMCRTAATQTSTGMRTSTGTRTSTPVGTSMSPVAAATATTTAGRTGVASRQASRSVPSSVRPRLQRLRAAPMRLLPRLIRPAMSRRHRIEAVNRCARASPSQSRFTQIGATQRRTEPLPEATRTVGAELSSFDTTTKSLCMRLRRMDGHGCHRGQDR